ncbi:hypothetical protein Aglo01_62440 [Actinokineospora globicatena]|nr:hypothetical protein Aglo01_62440 [Actinokineospora globicatena]GLW88558.1 hypothetical protein Aglo02_61970 [Actinokineospora globicatena]
MESTRPVNTVTPRAGVRSGGGLAGRRGASSGPLAPLAPTVSDSSARVTHDTQTRHSGLPGAPRQGVRAEP